MTHWPSDVWPVAEAKMSFPSLLLSQNQFRTKGGRSSESLQEHYYIYASLINKTLQIKKKPSPHITLPASCRGMMENLLHLLKGYMKKANNHCFLYLALSSFTHVSDVKTDRLQLDSRA